MGIRIKEQIMKTKQQKNVGLCYNKVIGLVLILLAIGLAIKYIFIDVGIDAEYQIVMAYRLATGDVMFKEMWEAHQTSAFLCAFFIKIYLFLFQTTTGLVLYLQIVGVVIDAVISYILYTVVNKYLGNKNVAFAMAWVFFVVSPKDVPVAEFANMQLWFCILLCIMMLLYHVTRKKSFLIYAALSLCAAVLSYPSCLILLLGIGFLCFRFWERKDFFIFAAVCSTVGVVYVVFLLTKISLGELFFSLENMLAIEPTHTVGLDIKLVAYFKEAVVLAAFFLGSYVVSYVIAQILRRLKGWDKEHCSIMTDCLFCAQILLISIYTVICWKIYKRYCYSLIFIAVIFIGLRHAKRLNGNKYFLYVCGTNISLLNFGATLILTDMELMSSVPYLLIALVMAFLPIAEVYKDVQVPFSNLIRVIIVCMILFLIFRNVYIIRPMNGHIQTISSVSGIVKEGPAIGVITEYMGAYMQNESMRECKEYIKEDSNIYLVGTTIDTLGYLYADTMIAAPSVMSTPGYNESISRYWEMNPEKYPDVVIASCWFGQLDSGLRKNEWFMNWLEKHYKPAYQIDGKYWRYYFREPLAF